MCHTTHESWPCAYNATYNVWKFYTAIVKQLILTTLVSIAATMGIAVLITPHWSIALFVLPLVTIMYVDMLGVLQWASITNNAITYVSLVMVIGMVVNFLMYVLIWYYESPGNCTKKWWILWKPWQSLDAAGVVFDLFRVLAIGIHDQQHFKYCLCDIYCLGGAGGKSWAYFLTCAALNHGPKTKILLWNAQAKMTQNHQRSWTLIPQVQQHVCLKKLSTNDGNSKEPVDILFGKHEQWWRTEATWHGCKGRSKASIWIAWCNYWSTGLDFKNYADLFVMGMMLEVLQQWPYLNLIFVFLMERFDQLVLHFQKRNY